MIKKQKKGQEQKSKILVAMPRKAQEEMVGFSLIVLIVAIILLVFLSIFLRKGQKEPVESYKVESFINALLQYTTECENTKQGLIRVRDLIYECDEKKECLNGKNSCEVLEKSLQGLLESSWSIGKDSRLKSYEFNITINSESKHSFVSGNKTNNVWGSFEKLPKNVEVIFIAYY